MSTLFNNETPRMLPKAAFNKKSFLSIVSPLVKLEIIKEGEGLKTRNAHKLVLSDSIYEKIDED